MCLTKDYIPFNVIIYRLIRMLFFCIFVNKDLNMNYYYNNDGVTLGPLPIEQLIGIITPETLIWNEDGSMPDWKSAKEVADFIELTQQKKVVENSYFYIENQMSLGPLTISELINKINKNTFVWNTNGTMTEWLPAIKLDEFKTYFKNEEPQIIIPTPQSVPIFEPENYFNFQIDQIINRRPFSGLYIKGKLIKGEINIEDVLFFSDKRHDNLELIVEDIYTHENAIKTSSISRETLKEHPALENIAGAALLGTCVQGDVILITKSYHNIKWGLSAVRKTCFGCKIYKHQ
jgi:hypothetical protein